MLKRIIQKIFPPKMRDPSFVFSAPRSGSTWNLMMLNAHPQIVCVEHRFFGEFHELWTDDAAQQKSSPRITLDYYTNYLGNISSYYYRIYMLDKRDVSMRYQKEIMRSIQKCCIDLTGKNIYIEKVTPYINTSKIVSEKVQEYFPNSAKIFLLRDGRDMLTSSIFFWLQRVVQPTLIQEERLKHFTENRTWRTKRFFTDEELVHYAQHWIDPLVNLKPICTLTIKYEEMIDNTFQILREVFKTVGAKSTDTQIEHCVSQGSFKQMSGGRERNEENALAFCRKGIYGDWKNYMTHGDAIVYHDIAGEFLIAAGYEQSTSWMNDLPEERIFEAKRT